MIKYVPLFILAVSSGAFAQAQGNVAYQNPDSPGPVTIGAFAKSSLAPVTGAPYSATISNESIQTLADGNRIVRTSSGAIARDSQGRIRQDAPLPALGNLSPTDAPHLVFIQDPVAQTSYTLDLTNKVAQKMPSPPPMMGDPGGAAGFGVTTMTVRSVGPMPDMPPPPAIFMQRTIGPNDQSQVTTDDLGSQTMEGILVNGTKTTRTIPAGEIGNEKPLTIVTEVWTSPDLKAVVYSKRSDPRMGEQVFQMKNIVRSEPDPSLFTVPSDFKVVEGPQPIMYQRKQ